MIITFLHTVIEAVIAGLTLSMMLGPAFFTILQTSLEKGFRHAVRLAFGIFLSDSFLVAISILGASRLFNDPVASKIIGIVGGSLLMVMGIYTFKRKVRMEGLRERARTMKRDERRRFKTPPYFQEIGKGFLLNLANPSVWIFWFVTVGAISAQYTTEEGKVVYFRVILFFLITLSTVFGMDVLKSYVSNRIKKYINERTVSIVNKVVGTLLLIFGAYLLASALGLFVLPESLNESLKIGQGVDIVKPM